VTARAGIYVALPFCRSHCHYCSNPAGRYTEDAAGRYLERVLEDLEAAAPGWSGHGIESVYLGGGTPTLYPPEALGRLLETVARRFRLAPDAEITTEANPETVHPEAAQAWAALGINRVSIGAQSFRPEHLKALGRAHNPESVVRAVEAVRSAGISRLSLDLIFALPGQTGAQWAEDLEAALALGPGHLSAYGLTPEAGTPLGERVAAGQVALPDAPAYADLYTLAVERLEAAGYARYEVSNFARPGSACRHNLNYWRGGDYLGLGAGAASHRAGHRWAVADDVDAFLEGPVPPAEAETLAPVGRAVEMAIFGLRTAEGIDFKAIGVRAGAPLPPAARAALERLQRAGLVRLDARGCRPTQRGFLFTDEIGATLALPAPGEAEIGAVSPQNGESLLFLTH
jgi:oxygen-independent coproporphyrinogen-3 oxidase